MPYSSITPTYPNNPPAGAPSGTSYVNYTVGAPGAYAPGVGGLWSSIMSAIANAIGGGSRTSQPAGSTTTPTPTTAPTQPPPSSFAGTMAQIAERRAADEAAKSAAGKAPATPLTVPAATAAPPISEDRLTRAAAADRISGSPAFDTADPFATTEAVHTAGEAAKAVPTPGPTSRYVSPVTGTFEGGPTSYFGASRERFTHDRLHAGADLQSDNGSQAVATIGGNVVRVGFDPGGYGHYAVVVGDDGNVFRYATHGPVSVAVGQRVEQGDPIGTIGEGHLHFEVVPPTSPAFKALAAGGKASTQYYRGGQPSTLDPAEFFGGIGRRTAVTRGQPFGPVPPADVGTTWQGEPIAEPVRAGGYAETLDRLAGGDLTPPQKTGAPSAAPGRGGGGVTPQARTAMGQLIARGYSPEQAAGMVGNFMQESYPDLRTGVAGDQGSAFGIGQWRGERLAGLRAYAAANNLDVNDLATQVEYSDFELQRGERGAGNLLRSAKTVEDAVAAGLAYERPRGYSAGNPAAAHGYANRLGFARALLADYAGGGAADTFAGGTGRAVAIPTPRSRESGLLAQRPSFDAGMGVTSTPPALNRAGLPVPRPRQRPDDFAATLESVAAAAGVPTPRLRPGDAIPIPRPRPVASGSQVSTPPVRPPQPAPPAGGAAAAGPIVPGSISGLPPTPVPATTTERMAEAGPGGLPIRERPPSVNVEDRRGYDPTDPYSPGDGYDTMRGPDITFAPGGGFRAPPSFDASGAPYIGADVSTAGAGLPARRAPIASLSPGAFDVRFGGGAPPPPRAAAAEPAGPSGANMTPAGRIYPDPAALAARERVLRTERAQREFDAARSGGPAAMIFQQPPQRIFASMAQLPPDQRVAARGDMVAQVMDAVAAGGPQVVAQIEQSPLAFRQLSAAIGPDRARELTTMLRAEAAGPELAQRFVAAAPAARVDRRVAERVGRMLASDDPDDFARAVKLVAANRNLSGLLRQVA